MGLGKLKMPPTEGSTPATGEATEANTAPEAPKAPPPSGAEKALLFKRAYAYDDSVAALEAQISEIKIQKSAAVKAIVDAGCGQGPFHYRGKEISISSRQGTFFFKDHGRADVEAISED